jgi:hypothetical protein
LIEELNGKMTVEDFLAQKKEASHLKKNELRKAQEVKDKQLENIGGSKKVKIDHLGHNVLAQDTYNASALQSTDNVLLGFAGGEIGGGDDDRRRKGGRREDRQDRPRGEKKQGGQGGKKLDFAEEDFPTL